MARESMRRRAAKRFGEPGTLADIVASLADFSHYRGVYRDIIQKAVWAVSSVPLIDATEPCGLFEDILLEKGGFREDEDGVKHWGFHPDEVIPNAAPPFESFWIERRRNKEGLRDGALFESSKLEDGDWHVVAVPVQQFDRDGAVIYPAVVRCRVSPEGRIESDLQIGWLPDHCLPDVCSPDYMANNEPWILKIVTRLMFGICFLHCKNVTTKAIEPNEVVNRERKKAGLKPLLRYNTIDIEPMKRVLRTEGRIDEVGLKKALHIVRGHFATYTPEKPLFGRTVGTFWVPQHLRGSADEGVVVSDYRVKAPPAPQPREAS